VKPLLRKQKAGKRPLRAMPRLGLQVQTLRQVQTRKRPPVPPPEPAQACQVVARLWMARLRQLRVARMAPRIRAEQLPVALRSRRMILPVLRKRRAQPCFVPARP
jgi:hypothetical protein